VSTRECWLLGSRVKTAMREGIGADVVLSWRPLPGYVPVLMGKKRFIIGETDGLVVREAAAEDMPAIRGLYAMTGGRALLLPVRDGLWTADGALVAEVNGRVVAYCLGSAAGNVWNIHEWGVDPETSVKEAASAFAVHSGCKGFQIRAEFAPEGGLITAGECVYIAVPESFLLGTVLVESAQQLAEMIEAAQRV